MSKTLSIESRSRHPDFRAAARGSGNRVDLRYASPDTSWARTCTRRMIVLAASRRGGSLRKATGILAERRGDVSLLVLDALRPQQCRSACGRRSRAPGLTQYLADPARGSIHSFGMAVDVTLVRRSRGNSIMGTGFDDLTDLPTPRSSSVPRARRAHRRAHRETAAVARSHERGGWRGINSEWCTSTAATASGSGPSTCACLDAANPIDEAVEDSVRGELPLRGSRG